MPSHTISGVLRDLFRGGVAQEVYLQGFRSPRITDKR